MSINWLLKRVKAFCCTPSKKVDLKVSENFIEEDSGIIRDYCKQVGKFSWTSDGYQDAVCKTLRQNCQVPGCVVEVGCYKGGLSAQIAYLCALFQRDFHYIDIDGSSVASTRELLADLGLSHNTHPYTGTLQSFMQQQKGALHIGTMIVDGDHEYAATRLDIETILKVSPLPRSVVFHDYSLRSRHTGENVQQAITDMLSEYPFENIGCLYSGEGHATIENPNSDGHYWEYPGSEGAVVFFERVPV